MSLTKYLTLIGACYLSLNAGTAYATTEVVNKPEVSSVSDVPIYSGNKGLEDYLYVEEVAPLAFTDPKDIIDDYSMMELSYSIGIMGVLNQLVGADMLHAVDYSKDSREECLSVQKEVLEELSGYQKGHDVFINFVGKSNPALLKNPEFKRIRGSIDQGIQDATEEAGKYCLP